MKEVLLRPERCVGCKSCELACVVVHSASLSLVGTLSEPSPPAKRIYAGIWEGRKFALNCRHCEYPLSMQVCPTGALSKDKITGIVAHNTALCIGCGMCQVSCPFGIISHPADSKTIVKCDRCPDRAVPACVEACHTQALLFADNEEYMKDKRSAVARQMLTTERAAAQ